MRDIKSGFPLANEHLGLGYIASVLRKKGFEVTIIPVELPSPQLDVIHRDCISQEEQSLLLQGALSISAFRPKIVGISVPFQEDALAGLGLATAVKRAEPSTIVVVGGHFVAFNATRVLEEFPSVDAVIVGEGELTMLDLAECLVRTGELQPVNGVALRGYEFAPRPLVSQLDTLPLPARDVLNYLVKNYGRDVREAYVSGSRGCYGGCTFCSVRSFYALSPGPRWRGRTPHSIETEIRIIREQYGINTFCFVDDQFVGPGKEGILRVRQIALMLKKVGGVKFSLSCRAGDVEESLFSDLKAAGLESVFLGLEAGVDSSLSRLGKGLTVEHNVRAIGILRRLGIKINPGFISITPWSTLEELQGNLRFLLEANLPGAISLLMRRLRVYSGTVLERNMLCERRLRGDYKWYDYDLPDPRVTEVLKALELYSSSLLPKWTNLEEVASPRHRSALTIWLQMFRERIVNSILSAKTLDDCRTLYDAVRREVEGCHGSFRAS